MINYHTPVITQCSNKSLFLLLQLASFYIKLLHTPFFDTTGHLVSTGMLKSAQHKSKKGRQAKKKPRMTTSVAAAVPIWIEKTRGETFPERSSCRWGASEFAGSEKTAAQCCWWPTEGPSPASIHQPATWKANGVLGGTLIRRREIKEPTSLRLARTPGVLVATLIAVFTLGWKSNGVYHAIASSEDWISERRRINQAQCADFRLLPWVSGGSTGSCCCCRRRCWNGLFLFSSIVLQKKGSGGSFERGQQDWLLICVRES